MVSIVTKLFRDGTEMKGTGPYRLNFEESEVLVILDFYPVTDEDGKVLFLFIEVKDITTQVEEMHGDQKVEALIKLENQYQTSPQIKAFPEMEIKRILVYRVTFKNKDAKSSARGN